MPYLELWLNLHRAHVQSCMFWCLDSYTHMMSNMGKKVLMSHADSDGPDKRAHLCSLIWTYSVHWHILKYLLLLLADNKGPDQPAWKHMLIRTCVVCKCIRALFMHSTSYADVSKSVGQVANVANLDQMPHSHYVNTPIHKICSSMSW